MDGTTDLAALARSCATGRQTGLVHIASARRPYPVRHATDPAGTLLLLARADEPLGRALTPVGGEEDVTVAVPCPRRTAYACGCRVGRPRSPTRSRRAPRRSRSPTPTRSATCSTSTRRAAAPGRRRRGAAGMPGRASGRDRPRGVRGGGRRDPLADQEHRHRTATMTSFPSAASW